MDTVNKALSQESIIWSEENNLKDNLEENLQKYLKIKYGVEHESGIRMTDIVIALSSPQVDQSIANNGILNELDCKAKNRRKKRNASPESPGYFPHKSYWQKY